MVNKSHEHTKIIEVLCYGEYIHTPLDLQLNDLQDADSMEGFSYSEKRTQTLELAIFFLYQRKLTPLCYLYFSRLNIFYKKHTVWKHSKLLFRLSIPFLLVNNPT